MSKLKVLLISPTYVDEPNTMYFPIGMAYLASYIASKDFYIDALNMNNTGYIQGIIELKKKLYETDFDVIGLGMLTVGFEQMDNMIKVLRTMTKAKIVIGGGLTSCESELVMSELRPDYMAIGEAELIFEDILLHIYDDKQYQLPKGAWKQCEDRVISNSESYAINELDGLPFPDYDIMGIQEYINLQENEVWNHYKSDPYEGKNIPISASRSCPFRCTFCHHAGMGAYRKHSIAYAVNFIKLMKNKYNISYFSIYDELFSLNKKRAMEFCEQVKDLNITFYCQLRVDQIDKELMLTMKDAGCTLITYGLESGSQTILDSMQKKITAEQIENTIRLTRKAKIGIQGNFLFGDSLETKKTIQESLNFQERNKLYFADWAMVIPYPGTILHSRALQKNLIKDRVQFIKDVATSKYLWNNPINLTEFSDEEYINIYTELKELNDMNHRKVLSKIINSNIVDNFHSSIDIKCPACDTTTLYKKVPFPIDQISEVTQNRESFFGFLGINIVCPNCKQEHHLLPKEIPHVKGIFKKFNKKLKDFIKNMQDDIIVMPGIDRYYNSITSDIDILDIKPFKVLDTREYRIGAQFLDKKIEKLSDDIVKNHNTKKYIILPWIEASDVYNQLLNCGIKKENILTWNKMESDI